MLLESEEEVCMEVMEAMLKMLLGGGGDTWCCFQTTEFRILFFFHYLVVFKDRKRKIHIYDYAMGAASLGRWTARSTAQWAAIIGEGLMEGVEVEPEGQEWARDFFYFLFKFCIRVVREYRTQFKAAAKPHNCRHEKVLCVSCHI
jgi:hypothetical protein